jgi:hypothetical protein
MEREACLWPSRVDSNVRRMAIAQTELPMRVHQARLCDGECVTIGPPVLRPTFVAPLLLQRKPLLRKMNVAARAHALHKIGGAFRRSKRSARIAPPAAARMALLPRILAIAEEYSALGDRDEYYSVTAGPTALALSAGIPSGSGCACVTGRPGCTGPAGVSSCSGVAGGSSCSGVAG